MSFLTPKDAKPADEPVAEVATGARLLPRITIQAFCEHSQTAELVEAAVHDRRMSKVALTTHNGGLEGAIESYKSNPTPNLIMVETSLPTEEIPAALDRLAEVCDATTRLIVLGHVNDVLLYRELIRSGVSEYMVLPTTPQAIVNAISDLFAAEGAAPIGRTIGFIGAKGGAGASTVARHGRCAQCLRQGRSDHAGPADEQGCQPHQPADRAGDARQDIRQWRA
jgi:pilus assembly protein CpaE